MPHETAPDAAAGFRLRRAPRLSRARRPLAVRIGGPRAGCLAGPHGRRADEFARRPRQFRLARLHRAQLALAARRLPDAASRIAQKRSGDAGEARVGDVQVRLRALPGRRDGRRVAPAPWASYGGPQSLRPGVDNRQKTIASFAPFADFNQPSFAVDEPANPLVAQNGAYTRYEIHFNATEFNAFAANGWSRGLNLPDASHPARFPVGSIAVKAAWRPLTAADPPSARARAYVERAEIVDVAKTLAAGHVVCSESDVALVGLHIAIKTASRPQWIWSTFEQVDNVPPAGEGEAREPDARDAGVPYAYYDPSKPKRLWPPFGSAGTLPVDWTNPPKPTPLRCRSCAAIRSTRRSWR